MMTYLRNITSKFKLLITLLIFFPVLLFAADNDGQKAEDYINDLGNRIIKIAGNEKLSIKQRREKLVTLIDGVVDSDWVAKFVLARHYRAASEQERARFKKLYHDFMVATYAPKFKDYGGEKFEVKGVANQGSYFVVKGLFYPKDSQPVDVDFRIRQKAKENGTSTFVLLDVIAEGVSLIETQRSEFDSAISANGLDGFLDQLEVRVQNLRAGKADSPGNKSSSRPSIKNHS